MKKIASYSIILLLLLNLSCSNSENLGESALDVSTPALIPLDQQTASDKADIWLNDNYLQPYNIRVVYKWNQNFVDYNRYLFPPTVEEVAPNIGGVINTMNIVKKIWIDSYTEVGGSDFIKKIAPREFLLIGGLNYNRNGTVTLGLAEAGSRISFFNIDLINSKKREDVKEFVKTIQHEYTHILNQRKPFDIPSYSKITPSDYVSNWYTPENNLALARSLGFISEYSRSQVEEDFAEMVAVMLTETKADYQKIIDALPNTKAKEDLKKKEALVVKYYKDAFNMDFYKLRDAAERNTNELLK